MDTKSKFNLAILILSVIVLQSSFSETASKHSSHSIHLTLANLSDYVNFVKDRIFSIEMGNISTIVDHEPLPCTDLDTEHHFNVSFGTSDEDDSANICDICPHLPLDKVPDVIVNGMPYLAVMNATYPVCISLCLKLHHCMAVSFSEGEGTCFVFNSTAESFESLPGFLTIVPKQPETFVHDWFSSRNTRIVGKHLISNYHDDFLSCLHQCSTIKQSSCVDYEFQTRICRCFEIEIEDEENQPFNLVYEYGHIAAFQDSLVLNEHEHDSNFHEIQERHESISFLQADLDQISIFQREDLETCLLESTDSHWDKVEDDISYEEDIAKRINYGRRKRQIFSGIVKRIRDSIQSIAEGILSFATGGIDSVLSSAVKTGANLVSSVGKQVIGGGLDLIQSPISSALNFGESRIRNKFTIFNTDLGNYGDNLFNRTYRFFRNRFFG